MIIDSILSSGLHHLARVDPNGEFVWVLVGLIEISNASARRSKRARKMKFEMKHNCTRYETNDSKVNVFHTYTIVGDHFGMNVISCVCVDRFEETARRALSHTEQPQTMK